MRIRCILACVLIAAGALSAASRASGDHGGVLRAGPAQGPRLRRASRASFQPSPTDYPETLHYDGPATGGYGVDTGRTFVAAIRLVPPATCSLKTVLFALYQPLADGKIVFYGEGTAVTPGPALDSISVSNANPVWNQVDLPAKLRLWGRRDFWIGLRLIHPAQHYPMSVDYGPNARHRGGFVSKDGGTTWHEVTDEGFDVNWNIRAIVSYPHFPDDVGATRVLLLSGFVTTDTLTPVALVRNFGTQTQSGFSVRMNANPGGYSSTKTMTAPLAPGDSAMVGFDLWHIPARDFYTLCCTTLLAGDRNPANDSCTAGLLATDFVQDFESGSGGFSSVDTPSPGWTRGRTLPPAPNPNSGGFVWGTPASGGYANSAEWRLTAPLLRAVRDTPVFGFYHWYSFEPRFDGGVVEYSREVDTTWSPLIPWAAHSAPYSDTIVSLSLPGYSGTSPDGWSLACFQVPVESGATFRVRWHMGSDGSNTDYGWIIDDVWGFGCSFTPNDVGTDSIIAPRGLLTADPVAPLARIRNLANLTQRRFQVEMSIWEAGYSSTRTIDSLPPFGRALVQFDSLYPGVTAFYTARCATLLPGDINPANDFKVAYSGIGYVESLERGNAQLRADPDSGAWDWGIPGTGGAHSGARVWAAPISGSYPDGADWKLTTSLLDALQDQPAIAFWHRYDFAPAHAGGNVKYSTDSGVTWELMEPLPGASAPYDTTLGPGTVGIPNEPAFSAETTAWSLAWFHIPLMSSPEQFMIRWELGSDSAHLPHSGWAIDDIVYMGCHVSSAVEEARPASRACRFEVTPVPANGQVRVAYSLSKEGAVSLQLYDITGTLVRTLARTRQSAGSHVVTIPRGQLACGVYVLRLEARGRNEVRKVIIE